MDARGKARSWFWLIAVWSLWTVFGFFSAALVVYRSSFTKRPFGWPTALYSELCYAYIAALLSAGVIWLARRYRLLKPPYVAHFLLHAAGAFVYASIAKLVWDFFRIGSPAPYLASGFSVLKVIQSINWGLDSGVLLYAVVLLSTYAYEYYRQYEAGLVTNAHLEAQLARAQLQALKMQLHPHFLFNALHTASALVRENPAGAERVLARLGDLLRITLASSDAQEVQLIDELRFLDLYLDIERTRFEDRLEVHFEVDPSAENAMVPHFILQPLVENAVRHGAGTRTHGAEIRVTAKTNGDSLNISVWDNGSSDSKATAAPAREGVGLSTTRARLERLYGGAQRIELRKISPIGFEANLTIPLRRAGATAG
jgi:sensor histidine kinase YesM